MASSRLMNADSAAMSASTADRERSASRPSCSWMPRAVAWLGQVSMSASKRASMQGRELSVGFARVADQARNAATPAVCECPADGRQHPIDVRPLDAVVGHGPDAATVDVETQDAARRQLGQEGGANLERMHVLGGHAGGRRCSWCRTRPGSRLDDAIGVGQAHRPAIRAFAWSSASRSIMPAGPSWRATRPAAARTPAWRMPPPTILRARRARSMNSAAAHDDRADRAGEALREAEGGAVSAGQELVRRRVEGHDRVEEPRAVDVERHARARARRRPRSSV